MTDKEDIYKQIKRLEQDIVVKVKHVLVWILLMSLIAILMFSCSEPIIKASPPQRVSNCYSCYQAQYLIYQSSATSYDTLMIWSTDTISADSLTSLYSWFNCGMDTTIFDTDSIIFNQMRCQ